MEVKTQEIK